MADLDKLQTFADATIPFEVADLRAKLVELDALLGRIQAERADKQAQLDAALAVHAAKVTDLARSFGLLTDKETVTSTEKVAVE